jgi:hypothetical protein
MVIPLFDDFLTGAEIVPAPGDRKNFRSSDNATSEAPAANDGALILNLNNKHTDGSHLDSPPKPLTSHYFRPSAVLHNTL